MGSNMLVILSGASLFCGEFHFCSFFNLARISVFVVFFAFFSCLAIRKASENSSFPRLGESFPRGTRAEESFVFRVSVHGVYYTELIERVKDYLLFRTRKES